LSAHVSQPLAPEIVGKRWFSFGCQRAEKQPGRFHDPLAPEVWRGPDGLNLHRQVEKGLPVLHNANASCISPMEHSASVPVCETHIYGVHRR
jgi:hypothetical protein